MASSKELKLKAVIELANRVSKPIKEIMGDSQQLANTIEQTNVKIGVTKDVIKYRDKLDKLKAKQDAVGNSNKRLAPLITEVERRYSEASRRAQKYGFAVGDITRENKKLERSLERLERRQRRVANAERARAKATDLRTKALVAAGAAYAAVAGARSAANVERLETKLETVIGDNPLEDMKLAREHALKMAATSLATESEILEINYELKSAGLESEAARFAAGVSHKVATITGGVSQNVGKTIGGFYNVFGENLEGNIEEKVTRIGELLTKTQLTFAFSDFGQMDESLKQGAKHAVTYGVSASQTLAVLGQLNTLKIEGGQAGTTYGAMLRNINQASEEFGLTLNRNAKGELDFIDVLGQLKTSLADTYGDDIDSKSTALKDVFGDEGIAISALLKTLDDLDGRHNEIGESSGVLSNYDKFMKDSLGQQTMFAQNLKLISDSFFGALLPGINAVLSPLTSFFGWVAMGINKFPIIAQLIGGLATAFLAMFTIVAVKTAAIWAWNVAMLAGNPLILLRTAAVWALRSAIVAWRIVTAPAIALIWAWNLAFAANPIGAIIIAITALVAGIVWLYKNWDAVFKFMQDTIHAIMNPLESLGKAWNYLFGSDEKATKTLEVVENTKQKKAAIQGDAGIENVIPIQPYLDNKYQAQNSIGQTVEPNEISSFAKETPLLTANKKVEVKQDNSLHLGEVVFHAQPGMDERQFADLFYQYIERNQEEIDRRARGRLHDGTELNGYG